MLYPPLPVSLLPLRDYNYYYPYRWSGSSSSDSATQPTRMDNHDYDAPQVNGKGFNEKEGKHLDVGSTLGALKQVT